MTRCCELTPVEKWMKKPCMKKLMLLLTFCFTLPLSATQVVKDGHPIVKTVTTEFQGTNEKIEDTKS